MSRSGVKKDGIRSCAVVRNADAVLLDGNVILLL